MDPQRQYMDDGADALRDGGGVWLIGGAIWRACVNGRPVGAIAGAPGSAEVMRRTEEYFERRVEL